MTIELDRISRAEQFIARMNTDSPSPDQLHFPHCKIEDPQLRISLRVGEMITAIASDRGIVLGIPDAQRGDDWLLLNEETVMGELRKYGRDTVNGVLKEVRNRANRSRLNGDREAVLERVSTLLRTEAVNRSLKKDRFQPPCVIPRMR